MASNNIDTYLNWTNKKLLTVKRSQAALSFTCHDLSANVIPLCCHADDLHLKNTIILITHIKEYHFLRVHSMKVHLIFILLQFWQTQHWYFTKSSVESEYTEWLIVVLNGIYQCTNIIRFIWVHMYVHLVILFLSHLFLPIWVNSTVILNKKVTHKR